DLGCGTGRDLEYFAEFYLCVGVDLQPDLVDFACRHRPHLDIRVGDMRTFRLGHPVDAVVCLGNSLAYLHDNSDIHAAFAAFAAHSRPGTVLVVVTAIAPGPDGPPTVGDVDTGHVRARVSVCHQWNPRTQIATVHRDWSLDDGRTVTDQIRRRVLFPRELELYAVTAGFSPVALFTDPHDPEGPLTGSSAHFVARYEPVARD
ncbi:MAG: class I SAM-dependent methyltransferase, partial [Pseudonocardiaceae bacterium]